MCCFVGRFRRGTSSYDFKLAVTDRRCIDEVHPDESLNEVRGSELHLNFKNAHRDCFVDERHRGREKPRRRTFGGSSPCLQHYSLPPTHLL